MAFALELLIPQDRISCSESKAISPLSSLAARVSRPVYDGAGRFSG